MPPGAEMRTLADCKMKSRWRREYDWGPTVSIRICNKASGGLWAACIFAPGAAGLLGLTPRNSLRSSGRNFYLAWGVTDATPAPGGADRSGLRSFAARPIGGGAIRSDCSRL